jgi:hypothetical protein
MKPRFPISGMNRTLATPKSDEAATEMSRRGLAISGAGRRLGISGMRRPLLDQTTTNTTPDDTNEGLP